MGSLIENLNHRRVITSGCRHNIHMVTAEIAVMGPERAARIIYRKIL